MLIILNTSIINWYPSFATPTIENNRQIKLSNEYNLFFVKYFYLNVHFVYIINMIKFLNQSDIFDQKFSFNLKYEINSNMKNYMIK